MEFILNYTKGGSKRIAVIDKNEFGDLERAINDMLESIEKLNREIIEKEEYSLKLDFARRQTEMLAYKSEINPHFMHNTLECIRGMALYRGEKEIAKLTAAVSRMFEYNVRGDNIVTIAEVISFLKEYSLIIEYRFMGRIQIEINAMEELLDWKIPKMLVQPLVENAVSHGLEPKSGRGNVMVSVLSDGVEHIRIMVQDNGCGMTEEQLAKQKDKLKTALEDVSEIREHQEIGIFNVFRRICLYYGNETEINMDSVEGRGTQISFRLPVLKSMERE